jgi:hypothetical protein
VINRKLAILLLSVSSLFLLVHGAIPHHHHGSAVCFIQSHCIPQNTGHDPGSTGHSHDNTTPASEDNCILNQVFITPTSQIKPELSQLSASVDFSRIIDSFSAVLTGEIHLAAFQSPESWSQPPSRNDNPHPVISCLSLRAPPTV